MLRQSVRNHVYRRHGEIAALVAFGMPCSEHEGGHAGFARAMGFSETYDGSGARLARPVRTGMPFHRRSALLRPTDGVEVLALGVFAKKSIQAQTAALLASPAVMDVHRRLPFGGWTHRTPLAIEEPFMDLVANSEGGLAVAFDGNSVLVGASAEEGREVVRWLSGLFAGGDARLLGGRRVLAFADREAARELKSVDPVGRSTQGYDLQVLRSDWRTPLAA